jgi:hypothetical protein
MKNCKDSEHKGREPLDASENSDLLKLRAPLPTVKKALKISLRRQT